MRVGLALDPKILYPKILYPKDRWLKKSAKLSEPPRMGYGILGNSIGNKRKVPHPYSRADDCARSLTGFGMTILRTSQ